jgi:hypothetical protein
MKENKRDSAWHRLGKYLAVIHSVQAYGVYEG